MSLSSGRRPWVGWSLVAIALLHLLSVPVFYDAALRSILAGGVVNAVESDPALRDLRSAGFWYLATGLAALTLGLLTAWVERHAGTVPYLLAWALLGIASFGVLLVPASGFWLFLVPATLAFLTARRRRSQDDRRHEGYPSERSEA